MRLISSFIFALVIAASGCATGGAPVADRCGPIAGAEEVLSAIQTSIIMIGETHGTVEGPKAFAEFVCLAAKVRSGPIVVALQIDRDETERLTALMNADDPEVFSRTEMKDFWFAPTSLQDGKRSKAMLDMLSRLHQLKRQGADIHLAGFGHNARQEQDRPLSESDWRSTAAAENLRALAQRYDTVIALSQNIEASDRKLVVAGFVLNTAAFLLGDDATSLIESHTGGKAWFCRRAGCGVYPVVPIRSIDGLPESNASPAAKLVQFVVADSGASLGFDGYLEIGALTESPPLQENLAAPPKADVRAPDRARGCAPPSGWREIADRAKGKILFIGELHGTNEGRSAFAEYVCEVAKQGGSTLVALEISRDHAEGLAAGFESLSPKDAWLNGMRSFWLGASPDGRSSQSMMQLLLELREMRISGLNISVRLFDVSSDENLAADSENPEWRDKIMARNIETLAKDYDRTIVLVGGVHAIRKSAETAAPAASAAAFLTEKSLSLAQTMDGGSAWNCRAGCKIHPVVSTAPYRDMAARPNMAWDASLGPEYDGYFHIGTVTPSPPIEVK